MVEEFLRKTSKKTWYKWSIYLNLFLFFLIAVFFYLLIKDSMLLGTLQSSGVGEEWLLVARDIAFLCISLTIIFVQLIRNTSIIIRRSL